MTVPPPSIRRALSCWEIAHRRAAQARERRRKQRGRGAVAAPAAVVRDLMRSLEGVFIIALTMTLAMAVGDMVARLWRRSALHHPALPTRLRGQADRVDASEAVYGLPGFEDAFPGETLRDYQKRHRTLSIARYRASARTQARWLSRALAGDKGAASHLTLELRAALSLLDGTAVEHLAGLPRERLAREIPDIVSGRYAGVPACPHPPPDATPGAAPDDGNRQSGGNDETHPRPPS